MPSGLPRCICTGRDEYSICVGKAQTKSDQGRKASVESLSTPPSRAGRDACGGQKPCLWRPLFSLLQMGANSSRTTPLKYIFFNIYLCLLVFVAGFELLAVACGVYFPDQGSNPGPQHWECSVLATGPSRKSLKCILKNRDKFDPQN